MIFFKIFYNKNIYKQIVIFTLLFTSILILCSLYDSSTKNYYNAKEDEKYRTAIITFIKDYDVSNILNDKRIININKDSDEYTLVFKRSLNVEEFRLAYKDQIQSFASQPFSDNNFNITNIMLRCVLIACALIMIILFFSFSVNFIYSIQKDISLLKLVGFSNRRIIFMLFLFIFLLYSLIYIFSIFISYIFLNAMKWLDVLSSVVFIDILQLFMIYGIIIFIILLSFLRIVYNIKKMSPIMLVSLD